MKIYPTAENVLLLPSFSENGNLRAVIEIPAGTNTKYEFDKKRLEFRPDLRGGKPRVVDFLPYPVNYGFVPNTIMDKPRGGDGDPLDVIVICESVPTGTILEVLPIGLILLQDGGEWDNKVLAVPLDPARRTVQARNFKEFQLKYSAARHAIEQFFMYYDGLGVMKVMGWGDEKAAILEIEKWQISASQKVAVRPAAGQKFPPVSLFCHNGFSKNFEKDGMAEVWAEDFIKSVSGGDPKQKTLFAIRKSGTGKGFPVSENGGPIESVHFSSNEAGTQFVEIWAKQPTGKAVFAETYLQVQLK